MNLAKLAIQRPIFVTCLIILMLSVGLISMKRLPVDLFPDVTFPVVMVTIPYPGAGPEEVETLIARPVEEEIGSLAGIQTLSSINKEGFSRIIAKFTLETDIKEAEQRVRDKVSSVRGRLPKEIKEPVISRIDPADQPILIVALSGKMPEGKLYDLANEELKPKIEQVNQVGQVEILGGRKREIQIRLDRNKLKAHEISASQVSSRIAASGQNIPAGKVDESNQETVIRTVAQFKSLDDIRSTIVNFIGNDVPITISELGATVDDLEEQKSKTIFNGENALFLMVYKQSGANTIAVSDSVHKKVELLNEELKTRKNSDGTSVAANINVVRDSSKYIRFNVLDVVESIGFGIILTIIVVFFFLGSGRSTLITGMALPNSLIGAFVLMYLAGFSINIMSLLALSLAVGLLIDDAIVVRENIFRHIEMGYKPVQAALMGTKEVTLAVIATTMTVIAVFGPIAFLNGIVGQFFKQFGLTICFAMAISLFDALTIAPMMSAYLAGSPHKKESGVWYNTMGVLLRAFDRFQTKLEDFYEASLHFTLRRRWVILTSAVAIFALSIVALKFVPKTFLPAQDAGEFAVSLEMPPGTTLNAMIDLSKKVDEKIRKNKEVVDAILIIGNRDGESNVAQFFINLVGSKDRTMNTLQFKDMMRDQLKEFKEAAPQVKDIDMVSGGMRPFNVYISGTDMNQIEEIGKKVFEKLNNHPGLTDPEFSYKPGKPEFQAALDKNRAAQLGISSTVVGSEIRNLVEGTVPAVFRENGKEYDIRVRLQEDQRNLRETFNQTHVPNINGSLVRLNSIASPVETKGPASILRQDRGRYVAIGADIAPNGPGMGGVMEDIDKMFKEELELPPGVTYRYVGQAEDFKDLIANMAFAAFLGILFIYLVLSSLYESFITPLTIMLVLPLAACGAFFALFVTGKSFDLFSIIGCIMLLGIATKNSILLVDYTNQLIAGGLERNKAIIKAGRTRLRPILMTSFALIAGMLPVAIGLNEASRQRTSMGIAVIGGLITSTLLTLLVVPAAYAYIDNFRIWLGKFTSGVTGSAAEDALKLSDESNGASNGHKPSPELR